MASAAEVRAGGAFVEFYSKGEAAVQQTLANLQGRLQSMGARVAIVGAAIAALGAGLQAPFHAALAVFERDAGELDRVSRQTGLSFENLGGMAYAIGGDMNALRTGMSQMSQVLGEAIIDQGSNAGRTIAGLRLSIADLNAATQDERLLMFAEGLGRVADQGERLRLQRIIFGEQGAALDLRGGRAGVESRAAHGDSIGANMSRADQAIFRDLNRARRDLGVAWNQTLSHVGAAIATYMADFLRNITIVVVAVQRWAAENRPLILTVFRIAEAVSIAGAVIGGLGLGLIVAGQGIGLLASSIGYVSMAIRSLATILYFASGAFLVVKAVGIGAAMAWAAAVFAGSIIASGGMLAFKLSLLAVVAVFGILGTVSTVWQFLVATGLAVVTTAQWLFNAALAAGKLLSLAYAFVMGLLAGSSGTATAGMGALTVATIAEGVAMTVATAGVNLLLAALGLLALVAIPAVVAAFAAPIIIIGYFIFEIMRLQGAFDSLEQRARQAGADLSDTFTNAANTITTALGGAWQTTRRGFGELVSGLTGDAMTAWSGITAAFAMGDFDRIWGMIAVGGRLAWARISFFAISTFYAWKDAILDAFDALWIGLRAGFAQLFRELQALTLQAMAGVLRATAEISPQQDVARLLRADARTLELGARQAREQGARDARQILNPENQQMGPSDEEIARARRDEALREGNTAEVARLENQLRDMEFAASLDRDLAGQADLGLGPENQVAGFIGQARQMVQGTFNADAVRGFAGGNTGERIAADQLDVLRDVRDLLQRIEDQMGDQQMG